MNEDGRARTTSDLSFSTNLPPLSLTQKPKAKKKRRNHKHTGLLDINPADEFGNRSTPRVLKPRQWPHTEDELRVELGYSINAIQVLSSKVKADLINISKMCPITNIKASLFMKKWGSDSLVRVFHHMMNKDVLAAWKHWATYIETEKKMEKRSVFLKYKGTKRLEYFFKEWNSRHLAAAWSSWLDEIQRQMQFELDQIRENAARCIQNAWRGYVGRGIFSTMKKLRFIMNINKAATKLQAAFRSRLQRLQVERIAKENHWTRSAITIQTSVRSRRARREYVVVRDKHRAKEAAMSLQRIQRGKMGREKVKVAKQLRKENNAALGIQQKIRTRQAKQTLAEKKQRWKEQKAVIMLQGRYRGGAARKYAAEKLVEEAKRLRRLNKAALMLQSAYRGHRGYLSVKILMQANNTKMGRQHIAAKKIQSRARGKQTRKWVLELKQERRRKYIEDARKVVEYRDDDTQAWFYLNEVTDETLWEPPRTGYTRNDGKLILADGNIIDDPDKPEDEDDGYQKAYDKPDSYGTDYGGVEPYGADARNEAADDEYGYTDERGMTILFQNSSLFSEIPFFLKCPPPITWLQEYTIFTKMKVILVRTVNGITMKIGMVLIHTQVNMSKMHMLANGKKVTTHMGAKKGGTNMIRRHGMKVGKKGVMTGEIRVGQMSLKLATPQLKMEVNGKLMSGLGTKNIRMKQQGKHIGIMPRMETHIMEKNEFLWNSFPHVTSLIKLS